MLGNSSDGFKSFMCLYMIIYVDYEGGNVLVYIIYFVGFILSDLYFLFVGGMIFLVGLLYGLVNQEVIKWIFEMFDEMGICILLKE